MDQHTENGIQVRLRGISKLVGDEITKGSAGGVLKPILIDYGYMRITSEISYDETGIGVKNWETDPTPSPGWRVCLGPILEAVEATEQHGEFIQFIADLAQSSDRATTLVRDVV